MYADYKFYTEVYGGKSIAEEDFPRLAAKASALIESESVGSWSYSLTGSENASEGAFARAACRAWLPAEWLYRGVARE